MNNVTRSLEMKFSQLIFLAIEFILVHAKLLERKGPRLSFGVEVKRPQQQRLAREKVFNWVI